MADPAAVLATDRHALYAGFRQMLPISVFVAVFGAAFGLAATQHGLAAGWAVLMSTLVFAGAAQFAALDLWQPRILLPPLLLTVFAINARHLLMGASLYPWLRHLPPARRYGVMLLASDANWARAQQALERGQPGFGLLAGGGLALWLGWVVGTWLGALAGDRLPDPHRLGLDMVMGCFLLSMAFGGRIDLRRVVIWAVAAAAALAALRWLPPNSHVVAGALAGGLTGLCWPEEADDVA
ncbi:AzlC family ABC transporter permease [Pseudaquabacterium rugosum]|uniref:AzlC family ABC transporter permease n=1 Tax=Pseudaquabacterium rugosum TaxID=2984194 RepID=A0ABU9B9K7_9BURK